MGTSPALLWLMINSNQIKPGAPVVCCNDDQFGVVDQIESISIKLKKDDSGQHHYIPVSWVTKVDGAVHVDRPAPQVKREWSTYSPSNTVSVGAWAYLRALVGWR